MQFILDDRLRELEGGTDPITAAIKVAEKTVFNLEPQVDDK